MFLVKICHRPSGINYKLYIPAKGPKEAVKEVRKIDPNGFIKSVKDIDKRRN